MITIKRYILGLTENISDQVITDFDIFGAKIVWVSEFLPHLIIIETEKSLEEIKGFFLVESAEEERTGRLI